MPSTTVETCLARIETTVTRETSEINRLVKTFLSNKRNTKKIIGLDTERAQYGIRQNKTVLLQLCDENYCLIVQLPSNDLNLPTSLFNFLNLTVFTFVGIGIKRSLKLLESEFGLTCKNAVEIGQSTRILISSEVARLKNRMGDIVQKQQTSSILEDWGAWDLNKNQIKLAVSNAYLAYSLGNSHLAY